MPLPLSAARVPRTGITIVEVLAALVLVSVGLLGVAGSSALMLRAVTDQAGEHRAVRRAQLRLASLAAGGCQLAADGDSVLPGGLRESWRVSAVANGARTIDEVVEWTSRGRIRRLALASGMLC